MHTVTPGGKVTNRLSGAFVVAPVETMTDDERAVNDWIAAFCSGVIYANTEAKR